MLTVYQLTKLSLRDGVGAIQAHLDVVSMPVRPIVHALLIHVLEGCSKTDVARA